jgi:hypothetical protein
MGQIAIPIPQIPGSKQEIEIEVKINGVKKEYNYRIELFYWEDCNIADADRVACLRKMLNSYDKEWLVYDIGTPTDDLIPVTFVRRRTVLND